MRMEGQRKPLYRKEFIPPILWAGRQPLDNTRERQEASTLAKDYPLEELSPRAFEQLSVALGLQILGDGVEVFGSGPDGGREATFTGTVNWSQSDNIGDDLWHGYVILQAKQREHPGTSAQNLSWLRQQISDELDNWADSGSKRGRFPDYLLVVTNVRLSSTPGNGGIDRINNYVKERLMASIPGSKGKDSLFVRGLKDIKVWHRDQLNGFLTKYDGIRKAFKGLLTVGDITARLGALNGLLDPEEFQPVMLAHAKKTLGTERWVNFSEAGGQSRQSVENIVIDLAAESNADWRRVTVVQEVMDRAELVLKPSVDHGVRHIVLTGQPGSGKSTITLFLAQMYRVAFTADESLTTTMREVHDGTKGALQRLDISGPRNHRWPIRVNLAKYADEIGPSGDKTLLRWMSERIAERADVDILPNALGRWIQHWPSLVLLDGLDEVTAPEVRPRVLDAIRAFVEETEAEDADVLVVVTTRPTGYTERLMPDRFDQFNLRYLDEKAAVDYGRHITSRRLADDLDRRDQVIERFERHATDAAMLRLMKTPLQVLIMTLILERFGSLPANRYELFWRYFETIYDRESAKFTNLANLLTEQRREIVDLHEDVGLELQVHAENSTESRSIISKSRLRELAASRLRELGNDPGAELDRIADQIVRAATDRLVLLVPAENEGVSFEIRSLQELMAARALSKGKDEEIRSRLTTAAPSPHWRYTLVFLTGKLFYEGADHQRDMVAEVIESFDQHPRWPGWLCPVGPEFAANLLDDGLAAKAPRWRRRLIDVALRSLNGPVPPGMNMIATGLSAADDKKDHMHIRNELRTALAGIKRSQEVARTLLASGSFGVRTPREERVSQLGNTQDPRPVSELLAEHVPELGLTPDEQDSIGAVLEELERHGLTETASVTDGLSVPQRSGKLPLTIAALRDEDLNLALELLFGALLPEHWSAAAELSYAVWPEISRIPVGDAFKG